MIIATKVQVQPIRACQQVLINSEDSLTHTEDSLANLLVLANFSSLHFKLCHPVQKIPIWELGLFKLDNSHRYFELRALGEGIVKTAGQCRSSQGGFG